MENTKKKSSLDRLDAVLANLPENAMESTKGKKAPAEKKKTGKAPAAKKPAKEPKNKKAPAESTEGKKRGRKPEQEKPVEKAGKAPAMNEKKEAPHKRKNAPVNSAPVAEKINEPTIIAENFGVFSEHQPKRGQKTAPIGGGKVKIIPLGGLGEIGKNMTAYECNGDMIIVDCGLAFPDEDMLGVDLVIPDFTFLEENKDKIRGLLITHGHEDHIGGIPFLLQSLNIPVYATRFTITLIEGKLREAKLINKAKLITVTPAQRVMLGCMSVEFIPVNHSIPDAAALGIHTPAGVIIQTGDFKVDYTPVKGAVTDLARFGELGSRGVLALLSDSTNAERNGATPSERTVGESFDMLFKNATGRRIIVATFSSNVYRVQQIINSAVRFGRKVAMVGRSMENVMGKAVEQGYITAPEGTILPLDTVCNLYDGEAVIVTTGSQGEPMSALTRMASGEHRKVQVGQNDTVIVSAYPIPGNEKYVGRVVNELMRLGASVVYEQYSMIHVSGHACREEQKLMLALTRPKYFIPVHGEYKHLKKHADTALSMGMKEENVIIPELGRVIELTDKGINTTETVTAGAVMVDGYGVGDVGSVVLRDRKRLGEDGLIVVVAVIDKATGALLSGPEIVTRGFVYVRESESLIDDTVALVKKVIEESVTNAQTPADYGNIKLRIRDAVANFLFSITKRSPMVLPVVRAI